MKTQKKKPLRRFLFLCVRESGVGAESLPYFVDVSGADGQNQIARRGGKTQRLFQLVERWEKHAVRDLLRQLRGGDAEGVHLASGENFGKEGQVRTTKLLREVIEQSDGAGIGVRLEDGDDALIAERNHGVQQRLQLARVMGVIVVDVGAVVFALEFKAAIRASEGGQTIGDGIGRDTDRNGRCRRRQSVADVVFTGDENGDMTEKDAVMI